MSRKSTRGNWIPATLLLAACLGIAFAPAVRAATYTWSNAAGGNWSNAANWNPAGVPATGDGVTLPALGGAYVVTIDANPSITALTLASGATLRLAANDSLTFTGHDIANDGSIQLGSGLRNCLYVTDSTRVSGTGEIVLAGQARISNPIPRPQSLANHTWIANRAGHTIRGAGQIWTPIRNYGLVHADASSGAQLAMCERLTNYGTARASGGATFYMDAPYVSYGGQIVGQNGTFSAIVDLNSNSGFPIDNLNGGSFVADGGDLYVAGGTIPDGTIRQTGGAGAVHFNGLGNPSDIIVTSGAELILDGQYDWTTDGSYLENHGTVTVRGLLNVSCSATGTCNLTGDGVTVLDGGTIQGGALGGALYVAPDMTVTGCGTIAANVINDGTISVDCPTGALAIKDVTFTNRRTFQVLHGTLYAQGSKTQIVNSGTMSLAGMSYIDQGATVRNAGAGTLVSSGNTILGWNGAGATIIGGTLAGSGRFINGGHVTLNGVTLGPGATFTTNAGTTTRVSGAAVTSAGTNDIEVGGLFVADAGIAVLQSGGQTLLNGGTLSVPAGFTVNGALRGTGTVVGNVVNSGDVTPDINATGLRVQGDYAQRPAGRLNLSLSGYDTGQFSHLTVTGEAQLDGAVTVTRTGGFVPASGRNFDVMGAGTRAGQFALVDPEPGLMLVPVYGSTGVTLQASSPAGVSGPTLPATLRFYGHASGFQLALPTAATVDVRAFDVTGRQVAVLADGPLPAGVHRLTLTGTSLPSGLYFARATVVTATARETRKATTIVVK